MCEDCEHSEFWESEIVDIEYRIQEQIIELKERILKIEEKLKKQD